MRRKKKKKEQLFQQTRGRKSQRSVPRKGIFQDWWREEVFDLTGEKTERKKAREEGSEGVKSESSKSKSIFRKMFICRSVKPTRGVYLPAMPSLSLSLCHHLLRSLSPVTGLYRRGTFCTDRTILQIRCKAPSEHAAAVLLCPAMHHYSADQGLLDQIK